MGTWAGAIIENARPNALASVAQKYRLESASLADPWLLATCDGDVERWDPRKFAKRLSRDLGATVIAFRVQSPGILEEVEHWENGNARRSLAYADGAGGWIVDEGSPQAWETAYFFDDGAERASGEWPTNVRGSLNEGDLERYEAARSKGNARSVMSLLSGGCALSVPNLCRRFALDPNRPNAVVTPGHAPRWLVACGAVALAVSAIVLEALR